MTDVAGGAAAPASDAAIPVGDAAISAPNAINNDGGPANVDPAPEAAAAGKKPVSIDDALDRATAKVEGKVTADAKDPNKGPQLERDKTTGKFAPKDPAAATAAEATAAAAAKTAAKPAVDPAAKPVDQVAAKPAGAVVDPAAPKAAVPARFSEDAKAVWDTAPEPVKAEVARMERELTQGIEKHKVAATKFEAVREYDEMAAKSGKELKNVLKAYVDMEGLLRQNPLKGLEAVCDNIGVSLKDVAKIVLGQPVEQQQSQADATIRELKGKITELEQKIGGVTQTFQQQQQDSLHDHIAKWAQSRPHFEVYAPHIAAEMRDGAANLDDAETRVFQKYPALAALAKPAAKSAAEVIAPAASDAADPDLEVQTRRGQKSITGAPSAGSNPAAKKRSKSIDDAIEAAFAAAG